MGKKLLIFISIGLVLSGGIYKALISTNFLFPKLMSDSEIRDIFRPEVINDLKTVYSAGNLKNHVSYHEINGRIRCRVWKFNGYSSLPLYEKTFMDDSMKMTSYVVNFYGANPTLTDFNKQFHSFSKYPKLRFDKKSEILSFNKTDTVVNILARYNSFGLFGDENECEVKIQFDKTTLSRLKFFKKEDDYFIIIFYGINGYMIEEQDEIIKTIY